MCSGLETFDKAVLNCPDREKAVAKGQDPPGTHLMVTLYDEGDIPLSSRAVVVNTRGTWKSVFTSTDGLRCHGIFYIEVRFPCGWTLVRLIAAAGIDLCWYTATVDSECTVGRSCKYGNGVNYVSRIRCPEGGSRDCPPMPAGWHFCRNVDGSESRDFCCFVRWEVIKCDKAGGAIMIFAPNCPP